MPKSTVAGGVTFEPGRDPGPTGLTAGPPLDVEVHVTGSVPAVDQIGQLHEQLADLGQPPAPEADAAAAAPARVTGGPKRAPARAPEPDG